MTRSRRLLLGLIAALALLAVAPTIAGAACNGVPATVGGATSGDDTLTGTSGVDVIEGLGGNDTISGLGSNDLICGDGGDDTIDGGAGNDDMRGGAHTNGDTVTFASVSVQLFASLATGTATNVSGDSDTMIEFENLTGSPTFDNLTGDAGPNTIDGLAAPDNLEGLGGDDVISDPAGDPGITDTIHYENSPGPGGVVVNLGTGTVDGSLAGAGTDTVTGVFGVTGSAFADTLIGDGNNNAISADGGDDLIQPLGGADVVVGLSGTDTISYATETGPIVIADLNSGLSGNVNAPAGNDTVFQVENFVGSPQGDNVTGGATQDNILDGRGGDDTLNGGGGTDTASFAGLPQGVDADLSFGSSFGQGLDTLTAIDNLIGSSQNDELTGDGAGNVLDGGSGGSDTASFFGSASPVDANLATGAASGWGTDTLTSIDNLTGSGQNDFLTGNGGDNVLNGGSGGSDTVRFSGVAQGVSASLAGGTATGQGSDTLSNLENLTGSNLDDTLIGDADPNQLSGLDGADNITGGLGADGFFLGDGADVIAANDGVVDTIDCEGDGPDSGTVDTTPAENYITECDTDGDTVVDFLDSCPTQAAATMNGCPLVVTLPVVTPTPPSTGAAKRKCKKAKKGAAAAAKGKKCKKKRK